MLSVKEKVPNGNMETGTVHSVGDYVKPKLPDAELTKMDVISPKPDDSNIQRNQGITSKLLYVFALQMEHSFSFLKILHESNFHTESLYG